MSITLLKQYGNLVKNVGNFTDGQVEMSLTVTDCNDSLELISLTVSPKGGLYRGGKFAFTVTLKNFPQEPPEVMCQTRIYHPNIDYDGEVCLNILSELWSSSTTLEDIAQGILFLFYHPNVEDPLSEMFDGTESYKFFKRNVRRSLRGESVASNCFERNLLDDFEEEEEEDADDGEDDVSKQPFCNLDDESESDSEDDESICRSDVGYGSFDEFQSCEDEANYYGQNVAARLPTLEEHEELSYLNESGLQNDTSSVLVRNRIIFALLIPGIVYFFYKTRTYLTFRNVFRNFWTNRIANVFR